MTTWIGKSVGYLFASVWTLVCAAPADAVAAGSVIPLSQERLVEATASSPSGTDARNRSSVDTGPFSEAVSAFSSFTGCLSSRLPDAEATRTPEPDGGVTPNPCITITSSANAGQDSIIAAHDGVLDVRARGSMSRSFSSASARSRLTTTFMVEGTVPFILQGDRLFGQITLTGPGGTVFDVPSAQGDVSEAGYLTEGSYTLVAEVASLFGNFNIRFTAGSTSASGPRCTVRLSRPGYTVGDIVSASLLRVENPLPDPVFVELKMWLRLPDGRLIPARNEGADGSMAVYGGTTQDFGPLSVMGVGPDIAQGVWEFGCRLLDPVSGQQLYENNDLFEIR